MRSRSSFFVAALVAACLLPSASFAGPAETRAAADALFREGRALVKKGDFAAGCAKLEASQKLDPAPGTLLALADCFEKDKRLASAWSTWNDAAALSRARNDAKRADLAEKRAKQLEPKLPRLQIDVAPESSVEGLEVKRNDTLIDAPIFGSAIPVDPGEQTITANAPGYHSWSTTVVIKPEPGVTSVSIPVLEKLPTPEVKPPPPPPPPLPPPPPPPPPPPSAAQGMAGVILMSVGAAGMIAGGVFGGLTFLQVSEAKSECDASDPPKCSQAGLDAYRSADQMATLSNITLAAGGGVLLTGIIVYAFAPSTKPAAKSALTYSPWMGPGTFGASVGGEF